MSKEITTEIIQEFMDFLMGTELPEGMTISHPPKLKAGPAFSIIWFLQEHIGVLSPKFEKCDECDVIFNSYSEGFCLGEDYDLDGKTLPEKYWGHYCDNCVPNIDFKIP